MSKKFIILIVFLVLVSAASMYFRVIYSRKVTTVDNAVTLCAAEQREATACIALYQPVCAKINIQCIKAPCNPVNQTISNSCEACKNSLVESYISGACEGE
ncbi:MAG: hypothetical protein Q7R85_01300 [bacterium]|nr:hypothetical protein [bacterium]